MAQWNGEYHPQNTACQTNERGLPEGKVLPIAQHQQARQHENNGRQSTRCRSLVSYAEETVQLNLVN